MVRQIDVLKVLACVSVMALAGAPAFAADNQAPSNLNSPSNPNCSPGVPGCTANYPTTDHSDQNPTKKAEMAPNCSPGQQGCTANYPTTDHSDQNPLKPH